MSQQKRRMSPLALILLLSSAFFAFFLIISGAMFLNQGTVGNRSSGTSGFFKGNTVGVIELNGVILDSKKTLNRLEKFEEDDQIKAVVLRLNSPGGAVAPSQEIYEAVKSYKKPLVVSMGSVAASGAYYIACGAKKVFANPGTMTGSIGVIMEFANLENLYQWAKIRRYSLKTGKFKDIGAEYREMTSEERDLLKTMMDDILAQFKQAVSEGRRIPFDKVTEVADGRIFSGTQAKSARLIDELGTLKDAIDEAAKQANIKGKPHVVYVEKQKRGILDFLMDDNSREGTESSLLKTGVLKFVSSLMNGFETDPSATSLGGVYWLWRGVN